MSDVAERIHDRYRVLATAGRGASGIVYQVVDETTGEPRALKIVRDAGALLAEFRELAALRHPSLPAVFEVGRTQAAVGELPAGSAFLVAAWIDGAPLATAPAHPDGPAVWALLADLAGALATIHAGGLIHADVAPQNVLLAADRAVLVDLGLAAGSGARGTPAYLAPEALAGHPEPRSDLYGLGAVALRFATGAPPFAAATLGALVHAVVAGGPPAALPADLPRPLADLIRRLLARDPDARPASALAVLDELDQLAPAIAPGSARRARPAVGPPPDAARWPGARAWIDDLRARLAAPVALAAIGPPASGIHALVAAALRAHQVDEVARGAARPVIRGTLDEVAAALAVALPAAPGTPRGWLERVARAAHAAPAIVVLELDDDPRAGELIAALGRGSGGTLIAIAAHEAPGLPRIAAPRLELAGTAALAAAMLGAAPGALPAAWVAGLHAASEGWPAAAVALLRAHADPRAVDWAAHAPAGAVAQRTAALRAASAEARQLAAALVVWGGRAPTARALATAGAALHHAAELARGGLLAWRGELGRELVLEPATARAIAALVGEPALAALATTALAAAELAPGAAQIDLAPVLSRAPLDAGAAIRAAEVAELLLARGRTEEALALAQRPGPAGGPVAGLVAARAAAALGRYAEVAALARAAGGDPVEAELVIARAAQRAGQLDAAESGLAALHAAHPAHAEVAGAYGRLLVTRARYARAREVAGAAPGPLAGLRAEAAGLAAFYLGALDDADAAFGALEVGATAVGDVAGAGRALSLRGMVAQQRGQLGLAADRYREAARRLDDAGELHAAAVAELNLGTVLAERGRGSDALPRLAAAGRVFAALGATTELIAADLNRGNALLAVGQPADAAAAADAAIARAAGAPHLRAFALLVLGDARRRLADEAGALRAYREALAIGSERRDAHVQISAYIALAEVGVGDPPGLDIAALCASDDDRDRWTLARARRACLAPPAAASAPGASDDRELAHAAAAVATRAAAGDRLERAFRGHALAARLAARVGDPGFAAREARRARDQHAALVAAAAPAFRAALDADPDLAALAALSPAAAPPATPAAPAGPPLRRLLDLSRRLNTAASVDRILDEVIDTAIELTAAERGFLLLRQPGGALAPVVARNFAPGEVDGTISHSIAERAAQTGEPVVTVDAGIDERFGDAASVAALRLRSVLAVPLRQRGAITGCIYVDHRLRGGAFDEAAASVLGELADIAAIAIENARLTTELDGLTARLSAELAERDAELARVKSELPDRDRLRHRYERIAGRSPAIVRMLELVDRAAATALPVVIVGESGSGKELVARALHDHGPRAAGPFVAVNCGAVPEPLLESELFGHLRGAFTGADRDRRGLFEIADGGTLFLDEIADTGAAMQAKLLRVLQDGELRRVGDSRSRRVDVRVVVATQRALGELVREGRFREDLRFRLEVISVAVPPLREREGDLPLLVERILAGLAGDRPPPRVTRAALRALAHHRWPGNVRELENALARGLAMGGDAIDVGDLPETLAHAAARPEPARPAPGDDLRLRPAVAATEQAYIAAAMDRARHNQTVAARLLGLSRFGLQKKLRRIAEGGDGELPE